jgi:hypothetical protein
MGYGKVIKYATANSNENYAEIKLNCKTSAVRRPKLTSHNVMTLTARLLMVEAKVDSVTSVLLNCNAAYNLA